MGKIDISVGKKTDESITIHAYSTSIEKNWEYSIDDGKSWEPYSSKKDSAETIIISKLTPHTEYKIKVRTNVFNASNHVIVTTLSPLSISSASDVYWDDENASITFKANIPTQIDETVTITFSRINTEMFTFNFNIQNGSNTLYFDEGMRNQALQILTNSKELVFNLSIKYSKNGVGRETGHLTFHGKTTAENSAPEIGDFEFQDTNNNTFAVTQNRQLLITSQSDLAVSIKPATPKNYASIVAYTVTVGNVSISTVNENVEVGKIDLSGVVPIVVTAIDSRGYTATQTKIVNYIPYTPTELTELSIERINNVEKMTRFSLSGSITPIMIDGIDKNPLKAIFYQTRPTNEEAFGEPIEIPKDSVVFEGSGFSLDIPQWIEFDEKLSYYIRIVVQDQLTQDDETMPLANGRPVLSLRKEKVGINNNNPQHALDIDGDLNLTGRILINGEEINLGGIIE